MQDQTIIPHPIKSRKGAVINVCLILKEENRVLLSLRQGTGYNDGLWGLVSGHVEDNESALSAMIREAKEEAGIEIDPEDLRFVHLVHRKTDRFNIDICFECSKWKGALENKEPHKCARLKFFALQDLPENIIEYIKDGIVAVSKNTFYSEKGWDDLH